MRSVNGSRTHAVVESVFGVAHKILSSPLFALFLALVSVVLGVAGVDIVVLVSIGFAWLVAFVGVARSKTISDLKISTRLVVLLGFGAVMLFLAKSFGDWSLLRYRTQQQASQQKTEPAKPTVQPSTELPKQNEIQPPKITIDPEKKIPTPHSPYVTEKSKSKESPPPPAPITSMEVFSGDHYKPGSKVHGIPWRAELMDLWMNISNKSGRDYKDFSVSIEEIAMEEAPSGVALGFYEIAQVDGLTECRTQLYGDIRAVVPGVTKYEPRGRPINGLNLKNTVASVKADCSRFPDGSSLSFLVAMMNVRNLTGTKFKPAAAGIKYRYTVGSDQRWQYTILVDVRDMDNPGKQKRSDEELTRLGSKLVPGTARGITGPFSIMEPRP